MYVEMGALFSWVSYFSEGGPVYAKVVSRSALADGVDEGLVY